MSFDEESKALYDVVAPQCNVDSLETEVHFSNDEAPYPTLRAPPAVK
jgi:hypothetical protein